jgi:pimeloyl-ACP methyl ester carboxylesterase
MMGKSYVTIDGVEHGLIVVPARSADAPVVLFTHGGPGSPIAPLAYARGLDLRDAVTLVLWDQRGTGMSARSVDVETITVDRLVADTNAMAEHVIGLTDVERVVMLGHSWGSYLGVLAVAQRPELYRAYVGVGQVNGQDAAARESLQLYRARAASRGDRRSVDSLDALDEQDLLSEGRVWANAQERQARQTGSGFLRQGYSRWQLLGDVARCRPYGWRERLAALSGMFRSFRLLEEIWRVPLVDRVPGLKVPVHIMMGAHDSLTPPGQARAFHDQVQAPAKSWTEFAGSAHAPFIEEPSRFAVALHERLAQ